MRPTPERVADAVRAMQLQRGADVVENSSCSEKADVLKCARDAALGEFVAVSSQRLACRQKLNRAFGRLINTGDEIEHGGFARAIRADESDQFVFADMQVQL